ncbi:cytochrome P450 [Lentinula aciculospora]|uniref:Cytochrome P450 n=1 Tax=Lentinula aciculospora TaxID=153920 RepID=A0A9W9DRN1_9AGAR|nr:cytochrome P450 [Lentinula aciculospora]
MYLLLASLAFSYIGVLMLYRLFFHPLRRYPGPVLAALTEGYELYYNIIVGGGLVNEIEKLHEKYGPAIRVGPNTLHFNYPQAYHDIYTYGSTLVKDPGFYHSMVAHIRQSGFAFCDPQHAKIRRGLMSPLFSRRAVLELDFEQIDKLLAVFSEHYSSPDSSVEMTSAYRSLTTDIITSYCFAECPNTLDIPDFSHPIIRYVEETFQDYWLQRHFPILTSIINNGPQKLVLWLLPKFKGYAGLKSGLERQIDKILDNPDILSSVEHETVYRHLLEPKGQERPSKVALLHEAIVFTAAGSDTVGNASYVGTFYALKNDSIRGRLFEELSEAWPERDTPLRYAALEKLPYLTAFIKETLRFSIGVIHPLPRIVGPTTPEIGGLKLPSGASNLFANQTIVEMSALFMHMNPNVFPDPYIFNPDRWLKGETDEMMHDFVPFSKGSRVCVGLNLAWSELYLIFGNLFRKVNLKLIVDEDTIDDFSPEQRMDYFVVQWRKGYRVSVEKTPV